MAFNTHSWERLIAETVATKKRKCTFRFRNASLQWENVFLRDNKFGSFVNCQNILMICCYDVLYLAHGKILLHLHVFSHCIQPILFIYPIRWIENTSVLYCIKRPDNNSHKICSKNYKITKRLFDYWCLLAIQSINQYMDSLFIIWIRIMV